MRSASTGFGGGSASRGHAASKNLRSLTTDLTALAEGSTPSITGETSTSLAALLKPIKKPLKGN